MPTLTASAIQAAYFLAKDKWKDSSRRSEYIAEVNAPKALIENTTADIKEIEFSDKKKTIKIYWNKFTQPTAGTSEPDFCTHSGNQPDSDSKTYEIDTHVTAEFTLDEALYEDNQLNISDVFADLMLKAKKACDEKIAAVVVSKLDGFTSPNLHHDKPGCPGVVSPASWASTYIEPYLWTPQLMEYFLTVARINKLASPFLLDGKNLNSQMWQAMMNAANANGAGANNMLKVMKYYEDLVNIQAVSPGKTFMVDRGTVAFASRARWNKNNATNPILEPEISRTKYSEASENLPTVNYDVYINAVCSGAYKKHNVLVHGMYGLYNGPANLAGGTGVHEFICGNCPT